MPSVSFIPIVPVSPASISGLNLWLDATDPAGTGIQPADGTSLTSWQDKSSTGYTLTSGGSQFLKTGLNSKPTINIGQSYFANSQGSNNWEEVWVVAVWNGGPDFAGSYRGLFTGFYDSVADGIAFLGGGSDFFSYGNSFIQNPRNLNGTSTDTLFPTIRSPFVIHGSAGRLVSCRGVCLGNDRNNGGRVWIGYMSEVFCFNRELTTSERLLMEGYCAWKWGIQASFPTNHPYYGSSPILAPGQKAQKLVTIPAYNSFAFTPLTLTGCQLWLDAADTATTLGPTTAMTQWSDKSGNGRNLTSNSGSTLYTSGQYVQLNTSIMSVASSVDLLNVSWFIVLLSPNTLGNQPVFSALPASGANYQSSNGFGFYVDGQTQYRVYGQYNSGAAGASITNAASLQNLSLIGNTIASSGLINTYINGTIQASAPTSATRTTPAAGFTIGGEGSTASLSTYASACRIYEILVFNSVLTSTQRQQIEGYLAWKWGIQASLPTNHQYYGSSPTTVVQKKAQPIVSIRGPFWNISIPNGTLGTDYTRTTDGTYIYYNFLTTGTNFSFILLGSPARVKYIAVAGGGGGGQSGGGGGAGGVILVSSLVTLVPNSYSITLGAGGTNGLDGGNNNYGGNGSNTIFALGASNLANAVGGGGGGGGGGAGVPGQNGGAGGGGAGTPYTQYGVPGLGTAGQGQNGGTGAYSNYNWASAGGGGYSSVGVDGLISTNAQTGIITAYGGNGGAGLTWNNGSILYLAGGGGGGIHPYDGYSLAVFGSNTYGGGTGGNFYSNAGTNGSVNTGGGGGGGGNYQASTKPGNGGSGFFSIGLAI
jgi:hypothetical protein